MNKTNEIFASNLSRIMEERRVTNSELAKFCGVTPASVTGWIRGAMPTPDKIDKICLMLDISPPDLLLSDDEFISSIVNVKKVNRVKTLPILGTICAGNGIVMSENFQGEVTVDKSIDADFALKVKGESMKGAEIYEDDLVYIKKDAPFRQGLIYAVAFYAEEEAVLRRVYVEDNRYLLLPENSEFTPRTADFTELFMIGKVTGVYRELQR